MCSALCVLCHYTSWSLNWQPAMVSPHKFLLSITNIRRLSWNKYWCFSWQQRRRFLCPVWFQNQFWISIWWILVTRHTRLSFFLGFLWTTVETHQISCEIYRIYGLFYPLNSSNFIQLLWISWSWSFNCTLNTIPNNK